VSGDHNGTGAVRLTVLPDDVTIWVRPGETVLEAMSAAGLGYRIGCRRGGCQACKVDLRDGSVRYRHVIADTVMTPEEYQDGTCLSCRAIPDEDVTIELRDERLRIKAGGMLLRLRQPPPV
jgi:CDP-4-dehydro-6-deoxyglucose reductase